MFHLKAFEIIALTLAYDRCTFAATQKG